MSAATLAAAQATGQGGQPAQPAQGAQPAPEPIIIHVPEPPPPPEPPDPPAPPSFEGVTMQPMPPMPGWHGPSEPLIGVISIAFFVTVIIVAVGIPFVRALARKWERQAGGVSSPDVERRLERIEQAVDAIAVEVERIGEGQRFTNRVIDELRALPSGDAAAAERAMVERAGQQSARDRLR